MAEGVAAQVIGLVAEKAMLEADKVTLESTLDDLGLDSLALVELMFALEETFGIEVNYNANAPEESDFDVSSVGAVVQSVQDLMAPQQA